jgi:serine/threonine protein kinase
MCKKLCAYFLSVVLFIPGSVALASDMPLGQIEALARAHRYAELGVLLKSCINSERDLSRISVLPKGITDKAFSRALAATRAFESGPAAKEIKIGSFMQIALFFEAELDLARMQHGNWFPKKVTHFDYALEYDPVLKSHFIILEGKDAFIGEGKKKTVTRAIQYGSPCRIVARQEQSINMDRELAVTKFMHGKEGIFETLGFGQHSEGKRQYTTIYAYLYNSGSLQKVFDDKVKLTLREKMKMTLDILKGLNALHSKGFVHKDMGARNYLVDISKGKKGHRDVKACIADLGRTDYIENVARDKPQGNTSYTAPEGLFKKHLRGADYYKTDIFAVGLVLYHLYYEKQPAWQSNVWVKNRVVSLRERHRELIFRIRAHTADRRACLAAKSASGRISPEERFEFLILRMIDVSPKARGTADELCNEMEKIYHDECRTILSKSANILPAHSDGLHSAFMACARQVRDA